MKNTLAQQPVNRVTVLGVLALLSLAVVPHLFHFSLWVAGFYLLAAAWRALLVDRPDLLPGRWILSILMVAGIANVVISTGIVDGRLTGTAMLTVMLGLKLLELRSRRDVYVAVFLGYFVVLTQFLFRQDVWFALYLLLSVLGLTVVLVSLNRVGFRRRQVARSVIVIFLSALPVAAALFILVPRLHSPLWAIALDRQQGITGIPDSLQLGSIGELSYSYDVAFRVRFDGTVPTPEQRYWRGLVLWATDGVNWLPERRQDESTEMRVDTNSAIDYEITLEPTGERWLFTLDLPGEVSPAASLNSDYEVIAKREISRRHIYRARSFTNYRADTLTPQQRQLGLQLPPEVSPRIRSLAEHWKEQAWGDQLAVVQLALRHFNELPYSYTLTPDPLGPDPIDQFLFETRNGFCEHYASSFVLLMRLAGIPARLVLGYQGGEKNPHSDYWVVRQSDAHAWAEVWIDQRGWMRVDPTAAIAPERILNTIDPNLSRQDGRVVFRMAADSFLVDALRHGRWLLDAAELNWHQWIIGFNRNKQDALFTDLGLDKLKGYQHGLLTIAVAAIMLVLVYLVGLVLKARSIMPPLERTWLMYRIKLANAGIEVTPSHGPDTLYRDAIVRYPDCKVALALITRLFVAQKYGRRPTADGEKLLRRKVRELRLPHGH